MRKQLLLSTGTICLMLASGLAYAQSPGERREEPKRMEQGGAASRSEPRAQEQRTQERSQERTQERTQQGTQEHGAGTRERAQGPSSHEEKGGRQAIDEKSRPASSAERNSPAGASEEHGRARSEGIKQNEQAQESRRGNREAETGKEDREGAKNNAEMKGNKAAPQNSRAESEKSKAGTSTQNERQGTQSQRESNETQRGEPPRNAAEREPATRDRPAAANQTNRPSAAGNAQNAPGASTSQTQSQIGQSQTRQTEVNQQDRVSRDKQLRIVETLGRARLAPAEHLNTTIRAGDEIPSHVHLYRLPPEIVSVEPEFRDYDYFTTDEDIVIVEPGSHRVVSEIPRDVSRIRAEGAGQISGGSMAQGSTAQGPMAQAGGGPLCQIMRRDASGQLTEVSPQTVGSAAGQNSISVTVQMPDGGSTSPIALDAPAGQIVVATQGQGDCVITLEPQTR